ncbi:tyrosine-type recombinase/integrase [uncultured Sphingomonas sp.]|uniref:tyrosine-type recombinase/integrase n=1 Tax=uncultured Sphingomonas sp. TaxID=158754 RepID=UPI0035CC09C8
MPRKSLTPLTKQVVDRLEPGRFAWDSVERGFGVRAYVSGAKSFVLQYRMPDGGEQGRYRIGDYPTWTVEEARREAGKLRVGLKATADGPRVENPSKARRSRRGAPTMSALADHYLSDYATSAGLRAATVRDARDVLRLALPTIGRMKVAEVTTADVRRVRAKVRTNAVTAAKAAAVQRRKAVGAAEAAVAEAERAIAQAEADGRKGGTLRIMLEARRRTLAKAVRLAAKAEELARSGRAGVHQANRLCAVLSVMFNLAKQEGTRRDNPCEGIRREHEEQRGRNLSEPEVQRLLETCAAYEVEGGMGTDARGAADAMRLLLYTGSRLREVLKAEWQEFDLDRGLWVKPSAHTKTKRLHRVELDGPALELLREMHTRRPHARLLFPGEPRKGRKGAAAAEVKPRVDLKRPWAWVVREAGLEDVRLHDLRRTLASFMLTDGASLATVGKALGHTQVATTARYAHLADTVQGSATGSAGRRMAALVGRERETWGSVTPLRLREGVR